MPINHQEAANAIAEALTKGVTHPGADGRQAANLFLPGLDPRGRPTHMVEAIKAGVQAIAEAIVHVIEKDLSSTIIDTVELRGLREECARLNKERDGLREELIEAHAGRFGAYGGTL